MGGTKEDMVSSLQDHTGSILLLGVDATGSPGSGLPRSRTFSEPPPKQLIMGLELGGPGAEGGAHSLQQVPCLIASVSSLTSQPPATDLFKLQS